MRRWVAVREVDKLLALHLILRRRLDIIRPFWRTKIETFKDDKGEVENQTRRRFVLVLEVIKVHKLIRLTLCWIITAWQFITKSVTLTNMGLIWGVMSLPLDILTTKYIKQKIIFCYCFFYLLKLFWVNYFWKSQKKQYYLYRKIQNISLKKKNQLF